MFAADTGSVVSPTVLAGEAVRRRSRAHFQPLIVGSYSEASMTEAGDNNVFARPSLDLFSPGQKHVAAAATFAEISQPGSASLISRTIQ